MKENIAVFLIVLSLIIMFFYGIKKNNNFINIFKVIKDHFKIFDGAKKHIIILYFVPIITSLGISTIYTFSDSMIEAIMVVISVVISALLSFQGGILNVEQKQEDKRRKLILEETNSSINFTVLINIILVFFMLVYVAIENHIFRTIFTAIISYILMITFLTIMIIIKRIKVLFMQDES